MIASDNHFAVFELTLMVDISRPTLGNDSKQVKYDKALIVLLDCTKLLVVG